MMMDKSVSESKSRLFQKAIENTPEALFGIDSKGKIQYANDAACSRFGYHPDELTELSLFELDACCDPSDWPRTRERLQNGGGKLYETHFFSKHGDRIPVEVVTAKVELGNRNYLCLPAWASASTASVPLHLIS
jgi:PAS domain S-box-containing protein